MSDSDGCEVCGEPAYVEGMDKCFEHAERREFYGAEFAFFSEGTPIEVSETAEALRSDEVMAVEVHEAYSGGGSVWVRKRSDESEEES